MAALSRQLVVRRWLIFAIYYAAIYCGHNSMATKWRAKVFDSTNQRTGNSVPRDDRIRSHDHVLAFARIWLVLLDFLADGPSGVPEEEKWSGCVTVGRNVNEIGWKERRWDLKWEMIRSVRKIVDFSNCEWNWQLNGRGRWVWIKK